MSHEPISKSIQIEAPPEVAFEAFTVRFGDWWPLETHSIFGDEAVSCHLEPGVDGLIFERTADGREGNWGRVLIWEPPRRLVFSWNPNPDRTPETEVEVRFTPEGATTRVDLEHRAWERLGDQAEELRAGYLQGWDLVLGRFEALHV